MFQSKRGKASPKTSKPKINQKQGIAKSKPRSRSQPLTVSNRRNQAAASAYANRLSGSEPKISGDFKRTRIIHRELVTSVTGSVNFAVSNSLALNPGIATTFPWLSTQALGWEQYRFNKLDFCYYTRCATSVPGSIILAPDYDAADAAPVSEQQASTYRDCEEEVPWVPMFKCKLDKAAMHNNIGNKFIRTGTLASNLDLKTYDVGNMHVCTIDGTAVNWGKVWVEYDVEFFVPQTIIGGVGALNSVNISMSANSRAAPFTGTQTITGGLPVTATGATLTFNQVGQYLLHLRIGGTVTTNTSPTITGTATVVNLLTTTQETNAAVTTGSDLYTVNVTNAGQTMIVDLTASATTVTSTVVRIAPYLASNL